MSKHVQSSSNHYGQVEDTGKTHLAQGLRVSRGRTIPELSQFLL